MNPLTAFILGVTFGTLIMAFFVGAAIHSEKERNENEKN